MHRGSAAIGQFMYVFGGRGDFVAIDGDPDYTCTGKTLETYFADTYRFSSADKHWTRLCDMPVPASHSDFSAVVSGDSVHVIGGQIYKHPKHFSLRLTDLIQTYDVSADRWYGNCVGTSEVAGSVPVGLGVMCKRLFRH